MLYNVPGRTGVEISSQTLFRLFDDYKNIYAVKEASGSMERVVDILANRPELYLLSGDDTIDYPLLANGAKGVISVTANLLPDLKSSLVHKALEGDLRGSKEINDRLYSMNRTLFIESNPIPIKAAMYVVGLLKSLEYRLPLTPPSKESMKKIEEILKEYKIVGVK
jgi:4-hydroxy-tetrahydrodipicolinate synthase